jgi:antitoxin VapB
MALLAALDDWRKDHPLPPQSGQAADKAFFDAMWDDAD